MIWRVMEDLELWKVFSGISRVVDDLEWRIVLRRDFESCRGFGVTEGFKRDLESSDGF